MSENPQAAPAAEAPANPPAEDAPPSETPRPEPLTAFEIGARWLREEAKELGTALTGEPGDVMVAAVLDALLDNLGLTLSLLLLAPGGLGAAIEAYERAQTERGRSIDTPHNWLIRALGPAILTESSRPARDAVRVMLQNKAERKGWTR